MQKILVVDDLAIIRDPIAVTLQGAGYEVICAATGTEALAAVHSTKPDLVLLDLHLPELNGSQVLQAIRNDPQTARLPVIVLSSEESREAILQAARLGIQGYLIKSQFSLKELLSRVGEQLAQAAKPVPATVSPVPGRTVPTHSVPAPEPAAATDAPSAGASAAELLRSLTPIITREQILRQVDKCSELEALSPTVAQLLKMTGEADCSLDQIARVIKRDPAIALKVLKVANSVVYSRGKPVDTVQQALSRIGVAQMRQVVLNIAVIDKFRLGGLGDRLSSELFWEHSIASGLIAAAITRFRRLDERQIDMAFTMGLLHDVARIVLAEQMAEMYKRVLDSAQRLQLPLEQVESRMLLLNHADLMDRVLSAWKFPKAIVEPIALHHLSVGNIRKLSPQMVAEVSTLALADRLAHSLLLGSSGNDALYPTGEFARILELKPDEISFIEEQIPEQTRDMKLAMLQSGAAATWTEYHRMVLGQLQRPLRPLYISSEPAFDGYRMLFTRLWATGDQNRPNVAIVHMTGINERQSLTQSLLEREQEAEVEPLPLIIISPSATLKLEANVLHSRMHHLLPSPFTISRLTQTVNDLLPPEDSAHLASSDAPSTRQAAA